MRGAFGKPTGKVARVNIGQIIFSVRARAGLDKHIIESLRRAKYKFPGRQNIIVSNKWGFTEFDHKQYHTLVQQVRPGCFVRAHSPCSTCSRLQDRLTHKGAHVKLNNGHGPIDRNDGVKLVLNF